MVPEIVTEIPKPVETENLVPESVEVTTSSPSPITVPKEIMTEENVSVNSHFHFWGSSFF